MTEKQILVLGDQPSTQKMCADALLDAPWSVATGELEHYDSLMGNGNRTTDLLIVAIGPTGEQALSPLQKILSSQLSMPVLTCSSEQQAWVAVEGLMLGAFDHLWVERPANWEEKIAAALGLTPKEGSSQITGESCESQNLNNFLMANVHDVIWKLDLNLHLTYISPSAERVFGYTTEEMLAAPLEMSMTPESFQRVVQAWHEDLLWEVKGWNNPRNSTVLEIEHRHKDGYPVWTEVRISYIRDRQGRPKSFLGVSRDIGERRKAQEALQRSERYYRSLIENSSEIITILDEKLTIQYESPSVTEYFGYTPKELIGANVFDYIHPDDIAPIQSQLRPMFIESATKGSFELRFRHKDGHYLHLEARGKNLLDDEFVHGIVVNSRDITNRKRVEEELRYLSTHDVLTGLFNRGFFETELDRVRLGRDYPISIIIADLDGLKKVNDTLGHAEGDRLLKLAVKILKNSFRSDDVVARIGGDEFAIILPNTDQFTAEKIVERIKEEVEKHNLARPENWLSFSIGASTAIKSTQINTALVEADRNMYSDKANHSESSGAYRISS